MNKINELAERLKMVMGLIDGFLMDKDIDLLIQAKDDLISNISYNKAVSIVAVACGGKMYENSEDKAKAKELEHLIGLIECRRKLRDIEYEKASRFDGNKLYG